MNQKPIRRRDFLAACGAGAAALTLGNMAELFAADAKPGGLQIGMNLDSLADWSTEWPFVDIFKTSRPWIPQRDGVQKWNTLEPLKLTPDGYPLLTPGQLATTLIYDGVDGRYPAGRYVCQFAGEGKLKIGFDARNVTPVTANRYEMDVLPDQYGILFTILESNPDNPVRDIKIWKPGFNGKPIFDPLFLERLSPFKVIRFMCWQAMNGCPLQHWQDRITPHSARQNDPNGGAIEYMVDLCNTLDADAWFCMPHLADRDFVRQFAELVKDRLKPDRKIYVEWSNEAWNGMFEQAKWVDLKAAVKGVPHEAIVAEMASRDWNIWHDVFGRQKNRVIRVAAGQHYVPWRLEKILDQLKGEFDAVSCAAYFSAGTEDQKNFTETTTAEDVIRSAITDMHAVGLPLLQQHGDLARKWSDRLGRHIPFVAYEGGQGITPPIKWGAPGDLGPWAKASFDCQTHPMMKDAYQTWLSGFADAGGELFMAFSYVCNNSKFGSWGHLRYQDEPIEASPKYAALLDWTKAHGKA